MNFSALPDKTAVAQNGVGAYHRAVADAHIFADVDRRHQIILPRRQRLFCKNAVG